MRLIFPRFTTASQAARPVARVLLAGVVLAFAMGIAGCPDPVDPNPEPNPSTEPGVEPGAEPGVEPGAEPGAEPGVEPDVDAGGPNADAGTDAGPIDDAGTPGVDGGLPGADGGQPGLDGGSPADSGVADAGGPIDAGPPPNVCVEQGDGPGFQISQKAQLRWKRDRVVERDLMGAFALDANQVCAELGAAICYSAIHRVPLGGHEPVVSAMYKGIDAPGATTPMSFDRVVLSACGARVDLDAVEHLNDDTNGFGAANLFRHYRLDATSVSSADAAVAAQVTDIYRRVLARDPTDLEVRSVVSLADEADGDTPNARDFSKMACYAVTSTAEFLFQ